MSFRRVSCRGHRGRRGVRALVTEGGPRTPGRLKVELGQDVVAAVGWRAGERVGMWLGRLADDGVFAVAPVDDEDGLVLSPAPGGGLRLEVPVWRVPELEAHERLVADGLRWYVVDGEGAPEDGLKAAADFLEGAAPGRDGLLIQRPRWW